MDLQCLYPDRFEGIGDFKRELHFTLQENAQPVIQPPCKCPIQLLNEIKTELKEMENLGVITAIAEPIDWVNALAFSRKSSGGLRVCLYRDHRTSASRGHITSQHHHHHHHHTHTLEITNRLCGSKAFSKLDAKHGYWSIQLDEESIEAHDFQQPHRTVQDQEISLWTKRLTGCIPAVHGSDPQSVPRHQRDHRRCHHPREDDEDLDKNLDYLMKVTRKCKVLHQDAADQVLWDDLRC